MRLLVSPSEFKGTLSAAEATRALAAGLQRSRPELKLTLLPLADGGPGTLEAWLQAGGGRRVSARAADPLGRPVDAAFGLSDDGQTALVEIAQASGLWRLQPGERNPLRAGTRGTGELILAALATGARRLVIGLGGSATVDGGAGALAALGFRLLDADGGPLPDGGGALERLAAIDRAGAAPRLAEVALLAAVDVAAPLLGPTGAARLFGPQKGASPADVEVLERGLQRLVALAPLPADTAGAGAAGGLGYGLAAFAGARLQPGFELLASLWRLDERLAAVDVVLTGEGRLDAQSALGKGPAALARRARAAGKRVVAFVGSAEPGTERLFDEVTVAPGTDAASAATALEDAAARWAARLDL